MTWSYWDSVSKTKEPWKITTVCSSSHANRKTISWSRQGRGSTSFSVKSQRVNLLGCGPVSSLQPRLCRWKQPHPQGLVQISELGLWAGLSQLLTQDLFDLWHSSIARGKMKTLEGATEIPGQPFHGVLGPHLSLKGFDLVFRQLFPNSAEKSQEVENYRRANVSSPRLSQGFLLIARQNNSTPPPNKEHNSVSQILTWTDWSSFPVSPLTNKLYKT